MTLPPVVSRNNVPTPPANATTTTLQIGTYNAVTDSFSLVLDLNDAANYYVKPGTLKIPQPPKTDVRSFNVRTPGERIVRIQRKNITVSWTFSIRGANAAAILTNIRNFMAAVESPPYVLRVALPGASFYSFLDIKKAVTDIPGDPILWNAKALVGCTIALEGGAAWRGDRLTLQNLAVNPGFETQMGGGLAQAAVGVFADNFTNLNAYTASGTAPTLSANVVTLSNTTFLQFGSPAWGAIGSWNIRFEWFTGTTCSFYLHFTDANNYLNVVVNGTTVVINHVVAGTLHQLTTGNSTLTTATWYWLVATQFPTVAGSPPYVQATLYNDASGAIGTSRLALGPVTTFDAVTALSGRPGILASGGAFNIGGAFSGVHFLTLFGPGAWGFNGTFGTGFSSGAWEQNTANTYPNGPWTSYGAARVDFAPAGTVSVTWSLYGGGAPAGTNAIPVRAPGDTLAASVYIKSSGLNANAVWNLNLREFNVNGTFLASTTVASASGNKATWTQLSGTLSTGGSTAFADLQLGVADTTVAGESANGTAWFDSAEVWNQTQCGQTSMPYCEMRYPNGPAQINLSGIQGDMPVPAIVALGTYAKMSSPSNAVMGLARRQLATAAAQLVGTTVGNLAGSGTLTLVLDATSLGGFYASSTGTISWTMTTPTLAALDVKDYQGVYHLFWRFKSAQTVGNIGNVTAAFNYREVIPGSLFATSLVTSQAVVPLTASATWTPADLGQIAVPQSADAGLRDQSQINDTITPFGADSTGGGPAAQAASAFAFLPVDGSLLYATIFNGGNGIFAGAAGGFNWFYNVYVAASSSTTPGQPQASWGWNGGTYYAGSATTTGQLPDLTRMVGGSGKTNIDGINPTADPYLLLDPTVSIAGTAGINQLVGFFADSAGLQGAMPVLCELYYAPLYLYPR